MNEIDARSPERKLADEAIANEPRLTRPPIPFGVVPVAVEALLRKIDDGRNEAFADSDDVTMVPVPTSLVAEVQALIAKRRMD